MALADRRIGATTVVRTPGIQASAGTPGCDTTGMSCTPGRRAVLAVENLPIASSKLSRATAPHRPEQLLDSSARRSTPHTSGWPASTSGSAGDRSAAASPYPTCPTRRRRREHLVSRDGVLPDRPFVQRLRRSTSRASSSWRILSPEGFPVENEDQTVERLRQARTLCLDALAPLESRCWQPRRSGVRRTTRRTRLTAPIRRTSLVAP